MVIFTQDNEPPDLSAVESIMGGGKIAKLFKLCSTHHTHIEFNISVLQSLLI